MFKQAKHIQAAVFLVLFALLLSASAKGEEKHVPLLVFDLAGGAALPANFLVGGAGGPFDLIESYDRLGWNPRKPNAVDARFGLPMAGRNVSKILEGLLSVLSAEAQKNLRMASLLNWSMDDSRENPLSILTLATASGNVGRVLKKGVGMFPSSSGGNSAGPLASTGFKPRYVPSVKALTDMEMVDPRTDTAAVQIYGLYKETSEFDRKAIIASIVTNVLKQNTGPGAIVVNGCDYHDGTETTGAARDFEIGQEIGRAVELAYRYNKPLFFQIVTDGGMYAKQGTRTWIGDSGSQSMTVIGYYSPKQPIAYVNGKMQLGRYLNSQKVDTTTIVGHEPVAAAYATLANYLYVIGQIDKFRTVAPGEFPGDQLKEVLLFDRDPYAGE